MHPRFRRALLAGACVAVIASLVVPPWRLQVTVSRVQRGAVVRAGEDRTELAPVWRPPLYRRDLAPGKFGTEVRTSERHVDSSRRLVWWAWLAIAVGFAFTKRLVFPVAARQLEVAYLLLVIAIGFAADRAFLILRPQIESWQLNRHMDDLDDARTGREPVP
jgi:hypothetical protein